MKYGIMSEDDGFMSPVLHGIASAMRRLTVLEVDFPDTKFYIAKLVREERVS